MPACFECPSLRQLYFLSHLLLAICAKWFWGNVSSVAKNLVFHCGQLASNH